MAGALGLGVAAGIARDVSLQLPPEFNIRASVAPRKLPRIGSAPATLRFAFRATTLDGTHLPPIGEFELDIDRGLTLSLNRIPACHPSIEVSIMQSCGRARFGEGRLHISIALQESREEVTSGRLLLFNGGKREGAPIVLAVAQLTVPVPTAVVMTGKVRRTPEGHLGTEIAFAVPKIAGGSGSLTALRATIHGIRTIEGNPVEVLTARCPRDRQLHSRFTARFVDGTIYTNEVAQPCQIRG